MQFIASLTFQPLLSNKHAIRLCTNKVHVIVCDPVCFVLKRQDGLMQRFIREINTTSRACVLWDLDENTDYIIQVQSVGLHGESQASKRVHFRTLEKSDHFQSNMVAQGILGHFS